jgi:hypothetical protein
MKDRPRKSAMGIWIAVATLGLLIGYPLSYGPALWLHHRYSPPHTWLAPDPNAIDTSFMAVLYTPLGSAIDACPKPIRDGFIWYIDLWM